MKLKNITDMNSIIITGANSGIGFQCALRLAKIAPDKQLILACRNEKSAIEAILQLKQKTGHLHLKFIPLDLSSLKSIKEFRDRISIEENNNLIALYNNAGLQIITETNYTTDGVETTFGVNHLGPFYLTLLLLPFMDSHASITFTSSGTHDPKQKTGIAPPVYLNAELLAHPVETYEKWNIIGQRRYSTSKLCNILTVYELHKRLSNTFIRVNAFDPGMVPGTGLARTYPPLLRFIWRNIMPVLTLFQHNTNSPEVSGTNLANLGYNTEYYTVNGKYFEGKKMISSSEDSYNRELQLDLWKTSIHLCGITQNETIVRLD
jgi:NAD(P)-dependent dehydrogenase (short-subunit alcohol dehydrogenase family)